MPLKKRIRTSHKDLSESVEDIYNEMRGLSRLPSVRKGNIRFRTNYRLVHGSKSNSGSYDTKLPSDIASFIKDNLLTMPEEWTSKVEREATYHPKFISYTITINEYGDDNKHYKFTRIKYNIRKEEDKKLNDIL